MTSPAEHAATVRYEDALKALAAGHLSYDRWVPVALAARADELERERDETSHHLSHCRGLLEALLEAARPCADWTYITREDSERLADLVAALDGGTAT